MRLDEADVRRAGKAAFPGFTLHRLARTPSTQDMVLAAARAAAPAGFCCLAAEQTAGRGRQGRQWHAPPNTALLMSVLLRPSPGARSGVPIAAGLAVVDAIRQVAGVGCQLKWPNDIVVDGRKLAGVLAEAGGDQGAVALGIGVNIQVTAFPAGVTGISLHQLTPAPPTADELLVSLLPALARRLDELEAGGVPRLRDDWTRAAIGLGGPVRGRTGHRDVGGTALGLDDEGALLVQTEAGQVRLVAGEVHLGS